MITRHLHLFAHTYRFQSNRLISPRAVHRRSFAALSSICDPVMLMELAMMGGLSTALFVIILAPYFLRPYLYKKDDLKFRLSVLFNSHLSTEWEPFSTTETIYEREALRDKIMRYVYQVFAHESCEALDKYFYLLNRNEFKHSIEPKHLTKLVLNHILTLCKMNKFPNYSTAERVEAISAYINHLKPAPKVIEPKKFEL
jgi:hypothetical protein